MSGLGKKRTKLGEWLDSRGMSQIWLATKSELSRETIGDLCSDKEKLPTMKTVKKILTALRTVDPTVKQDDFWSM